MAGALHLDIERLRFPIDREKEESEKATVGVKARARERSMVPEGFEMQNYEIFVILRQFLQPGTEMCLGNAINDIINVFPDGTNDLRSLNTVCLELAEQIPFSHLSHLKLARLVYSIGGNLRRLEKSKGTDIKSATGFFYQYLREDLVDNNFRPGANGADPSRYVNYQAFLANLRETGIPLLMPKSFIMHEDTPLVTKDLSQADLDDARKMQGQAVCEAWVMGAAQ